MSIVALHRNVLVELKQITFMHGLSTVWIERSLDRLCYLISFSFIFGLFERHGQKCDDHNLLCDRYFYQSSYFFFFFSFFYDWHKFTVVMTLFIRKMPNEKKWPQTMKKTSKINEKPFEIQQQFMQNDLYGSNRLIIVSHRCEWAAILVWNAHWKPND